MEDECNVADFLDLLEKMIYLFKEISHDNKPIYDMIKAIVNHGPLAELVNELSEERTLEIINDLNAKEIGKLMNIGKGPINIFVLISIGEKIVPFLKKANSSKGVSKLISVFTGGREGNTEKNNMVEKIMDELSEEHTMKMVNGFNAQEVEKLTDCLENACNIADSEQILEKMLNVLKGLSHGDKLMYNLIKELFKHGPLAELVNELSEERALEIINIDKGKARKSAIISIGKKILPIIKKVKDHKVVSKLMSIFTDDEDEKTDLSYYQFIHGGLHPGMSVYMQGTVLERSNRTWVNFQVNFACGQHKEADVPLHFSTHINEKTVALSTRQAGRWGKEEKHMNPFRTGEQFEFIFIVRAFSYEVLVNRKAFCIYSHRIPPQNVQVIRIDGDLELQSVSVMGGPLMTLPYHHPVSGGLHPGMSVYLQGKVLKNSNRFRVDLACGKLEEADILLHFNPRINQGSVVLNSHQKWWRNEERQRNPFRKGNHFEIIFTVNETEYQILVNGEHLGNFRHRLPPQLINFINLFGGLEFRSLTIVKGQLVETMLLTGHTVYYPPVPYTGNIPGGLGTNRTITVRGFIPENATSSAINLMASKNIVLHLNPRMKPLGSVLRNTFLNGRWGAEEKGVPFNPFQFGQYFEISICCDKKKFKVYSSGRHLFNFQHRFANIGQIRTLEIKGDIALSYIKY
ncbi:uncharacterized protein [Erythrolamprus reginae]|uniref:uncharacterized protein n=1 Tax=Erythrolamprus reginae TaxID=121349 RepID=UPI00396C5751